MISVKHSNSLEFIKILSSHNFYIKIHIYLLFLLIFILFLINFYLFFNVIFVK